ncbi:MAG: hypothetical protein EB051_00365 [Chlamydiia bacterium]|nr:hypothetical protein [Chlamydiia bacterium]
MKKSVIIFGFVFFVMTTGKVHANQKRHFPLNSVTYSLSGGRFGDDLLSYIHAKWISYRYGIPLIYKSFKYSNQLVMHEIELLKEEQMISRFRKQLTLGKGDRISHEFSSVLYIVPYFPHSSYEHLHYDLNFPYFHMDYDDPEFKSILRKAIKPLSELSKPQIPKDCTSVALHVRTGIGFDSPEFKSEWPHKGPPISYYLNQLRILSNLYQSKPLYVHLFTDDPQPQDLLKIFRDELSDLNIIFSARESGNSHNLHVLEDFFAMLDFDCLIRADSNYSICVEILGDFQAVCSVEHVAWKNDLPYIDKSRVVVKK